LRVGVLDQCNALDSFHRHFHVVDLEWYLHFTRLIGEGAEGSVDDIFC